MSEPELAPDFFKEIVDTVGVGVAVYGSDGRYRYVNRAYADLLETTPSELCGTAVWDAVPSLEASAFDGYWASFDEGETRTDETTHEFGGTAVPVETVTTRRRIDGTPYHFGTIKDISERKEHERELRRQNERLESFAGVVSHDLRNPLNVAQGYLDILQEDVDRDELDLIEGSLDRMELLISDLLTLARGGRDIGETSALSMSESARGAWGSIETVGATLETPGAEWRVTADAERLQQLLENLFRNAVEHGSEDVTIRVGALTHDGGFYVADDGPGIDQDVEGELFDAGVSTNDEGTGFGLAIVEEIAEAHGWDVRVEESASGGARFEFHTGDRRR